MTLLVSRLDADDVVDSTPDHAIGYSLDGSDASVAIENPAAENGEIETSGDGLSWLNSARIFANPSGDSVTLTCLIGDPRGAFAMEVRRLNDGRIVIHLPHPGESLPHMLTAELHPGTLVITSEAGNAAKAIVFSMDPPAGDDDDDDDQELGDLHRAGHK